MSEGQAVREISSLQHELDSVQTEMNSMLTNDSFLFTTQRCPVLFDAEDAENTEIEKIVQALKQELLAGSNASAQSLLYLQNISATSIEAAYRGHLGRKAFSHRHVVWLQERRIAATIKIQRWLLMVTGMRLARMRRNEIENEWKSAAATQIQRIFKGRFETNAVRSVRNNVRNADFQFHLTRGGAFEALSKASVKTRTQTYESPRDHSCSDASTSTSEDDDLPVGSVGWLPRGVRHNVHDETFRKS